MQETEQKIKNIITELRPFLQNDGGDLEFVKYEDNIVYVKLLGACNGCPMMEVTLKGAIEESIQNEVPEVKEVRNVLS